ncbi:kelch-like protein 2 [Eurytemora carolleeae]|uniref:kelch-like protein 2 n=1 Tax=Eurytemora carolleeae TaxID=1294199 RepID=UPI000C7596FF|nr:kelch-like protein 2 [Eurytemora carolleeae]|eukprot:XP_023341441.1 kelch-like protein 2 [Eurytemora affinis]
MVNNHDHVGVKDIERRIVEAGLQTTNNTLRVWQEDFPTCQIPEDPLNGRFDCYMNIRTEKCFLVCTPGFVPRLFRGTYCKEQGKTGEWNVSISSMDCIPTTTIVVIGGHFKDHLDRVFKPYQPEELRFRTGTPFYRPTAQYFRGKLLISGGFYTKNMMHHYNSSSKALNPFLNLKSFHEIGTTVVVHDKLYTLGPYTNLAEYYQENNEGQTFAGPILQSTGFYRCAVRYLDRYFLVIDEISTRQYDVLTGAYIELQHLLTRRTYFGCGTFLNKTTGEEVVLVAGGGGPLYGTSVPDCEVYTPSLGTWSSISPLNQPRVAGHIVTTASGVFIVGGWELSTMDKQVEELDTTTLTWKWVIPAVKAGNEGAVVAVPDGVV